MAITGSRCKLEHAGDLRARPAREGRQRLPLLRSGRGTHGRGFWILDDVTPLRQRAAVQSAPDLYLLKPAIAVRVRGATNDPTPWPPELPAGENPLAGATIDYYIGAPVTGPLTLEIVNATGRIVRRYSSTDRILDPDPARDPDAYNLVCQKDQKAPDCNLPLYWAAPSLALSARPGMHRATWDLRYDPIEDERDDLGEDESGNGAVPHRTMPAMDAPWAPPGSYTVRLSAGGKTLEQPLVLRMDPRVKTPPAGLAQLSALSKEMYENAVNVRLAYVLARALDTRLASASDARARAFREELDSLAPDEHEAEIRAPRKRGRTDADEKETLKSVGDDLMRAAMAMQGADITPTANQVAACARARAKYHDVIARWTALAQSVHATLDPK
jgi:hypothetical protein